MTNVKIIAAIDVKLTISSPFSVDNQSMTSSTTEVSKIYDEPDQIAP